MILPASLSLTRHSNETHDIRKNLRLRNPDDPASNLHRDHENATFSASADQPSFGSSTTPHLFEGLASSPFGSRRVRRLRPNAMNRSVLFTAPNLLRLLRNRVCVRCEAAALRRAMQWRCGGHGAVGQPTRFSALAAPHCRGKWTRAEDKACCDDPAFIFV
ncbi:hypothetical protein EVAR_58558_1 [Eumeta japonica]|uniref:Uncharacterized protein n=1 Tax=Eumeta variegata TaxID=151549 RepID=A0A4C1YGV1_EUMVA|nr:hypothetical protein EVAR_58558_1 [Eumeta japonica]